MRPQSERSEAAEPASRSGTFRVGELKADDTHEATYRAYQELFEGAPEAYLVTDALGAIVHVNRQACVLFNAGRSALEGRPLASFFARCDRARTRDLIEVLGDAVLHTEVRVQPRAEEAQWVSVTARRGTEPDGRPCIRWLIRSAVAQRQEEARRDAAEDGLRAQIHELEASRRRLTHFLEREQEARRAAEERSRHKSQVLAEVAHALSGPLRAIDGWLQWKEAESEPSAQRHATQSMSRSVQALCSIVEDLADHARIERYQPMLRVQSINLMQMVIEVMEELRVLASLKQLTFELAATTYSIAMRGDPFRLRQVFRSLIGNAIKFTPARGHVRVEVATSGDYAEVTVVDTGLGIAPEALASIFRPFARARVPGARRSGLGLGLNISQRLVELHGGSLEAQSEGAMRGAKFRVRLPILNAVTTSA